MTEYSSPYLPENTKIVLPPQPQQSLGFVYLIGLVIVFVAGLMARSLFGGETWEAATVTLSRSNEVYAASSAPSPQPSDLRVVLEWPTATATTTPRPTIVPTTDAAKLLDFCTQTPAPGTICKIPPPTPLPPTPYPSCTKADSLIPGNLCLWPGSPVAQADVP